MYQDGIRSWLVWFKAEAQQRRQVSCGLFDEFKTADTPETTLRMRSEVSGPHVRTFSYFHNIVLQKGYIRLPVLLHLRARFIEVSSLVWGTAVDAVP